MELGDPPFAKAQEGPRETSIGQSECFTKRNGDHGLGNGVHSRQEIRFPLRKIDKEDVGGRKGSWKKGRDKAVSKIVTLICRDLPTVAETQTPFSLHVF